MRSTHCVPLTANRNKIVFHLLKSPLKFSEIEEKNFKNLHFFSKNFIKFYY